MSTSTKVPSVASSKPPTAPKASPAAAAKKTESLAGDSAAATAKEDTMKAIEKLETKQKSINTNNVSRVANSKITAADEKLHPLVSLKTSKPLEKFPETAQGVNKLALVQINDYLTQLDTEKTGSEAARRERLRLQIGLTPNAA